MKELESNDKAECGADGGKSAAQITEIVKGLTCVVRIDRFNVS